MTQDELNLVLDALKWCHGGEPCGTAEAIAVVEKALAQPEQEPHALQGLAAYLRCEAGGVFVGSPSHDALLQWAREVDAAKAQRTWVGLTDDELLHIGVATGLERVAAQMIANKLKEKNFV